MTTPSKASQRILPVDEPAPESLDQVTAAVADLCWKATQYGATEDGDTLAYILPKGALHRLVGVMDQIGRPVALRTSATDPHPAPQDAQQPPQDRSGDALGAPGGVTGSQGLGEALRQERYFARTMDGHDRLLALADQADALERERDDYLVQRDEENEARMGLAWDVRKAEAKIDRARTLAAEWLEPKRGNTANTFGRRLRAALDGAQ